MSYGSWTYTQEYSSLLGETSEREEAIQDLWASSCETEGLNRLPLHLGVQLGLELTPIWV
jgi:hypothetical protein